MKCVAYEDNRKLKGRQWGRATTKSLVSQKTESEFDPNAGFGLISLDVSPNNELYSKLHSGGRDVEIIYPRHIRNEMKGIIDSLTRLYSESDRTESASHK